MAKKQQQSTVLSRKVKIQFQCWASVADGGPTLKKHWVDVSCLLGSTSRSQKAANAYFSSKQYSLLTSACTYFQVSSYGVMAYWLLLLTFKVSIYCLLVCVYFSSEQVAHNTLNLLWSVVAPTSQTLDQCWFNISCLVVVKNTKCSKIVMFVSSVKC